MTSFGEDTFHRIYAVTTNGPVYRLVPAPGAEGRTLGDVAGPGRDSRFAKLVRPSRAIEGPGPMTSQQPARNPACSACGWRCYSRDRWRRQ